MARGLPKQVEEMAAVVRAAPVVSGPTAAKGMLQAARMAATDAVTQVAEAWMDAAPRDRTYTHAEVGALLIKLSQAALEDMRHG